LSPFHHILSLIGLSLATFLIVLDYTVANVSIPYIAGGLSVSTDQGTYVITSFAVGNAIALPISGWLTKKIGDLRLLLTSLALFIFCSFLCGSAFSFPWLIISRFLQGIVAGPLIPLSQSLLIATNPPEKKNQVLAFWSAVVVAAPVLGPFLGGWISFNYAWPWIFYINVPFGLLALLLIGYTIHRPRNSSDKEPFTDWMGFTLLIFFVTSLQVALDKGEQFDWLGSPFIRLLAILCVVSFTYLFVLEKFHSKPLISFQFFSIPSFTSSLLLMGIMYAMYFGSVVLIPLWLQTSMGYDAIWAGIAVAPIGLAPLFFSSFVGRFVGRCGAIKPLILCFLFFALSCFYTAFFNTDINLTIVWISRFLLGCGLMFFITPLFILSVQDIEEHLLPSATGIFHFVRALSGGIGTSLFTTLWIRRTIFHHERLSSALTTTNPLAQEFLEQCDSHRQESLALMNTLVDKQAAMLSLNDCFYCMGWIFLLLLLILPFARGKTRSREITIQKNV